MRFLNPFDTDSATTQLDLFDPEQLITQVPAPPPLLNDTARLDGSTLPSTAAATITLAQPALAGTTSATNVVAISPSAHDVLAAKGQAVVVSSLFSVAASSAKPTYLIVSGLDRVEYTAGYKTSSMGHLAAGSTTQGFSNFSGDGWSVSVVFTYQAATGQYTNATYGNFSQLAFDTGGNLGDTATFSLFGTSSAAMAASYAANPLIMSTNAAYFADYGSVAIVTGASAATSPSAATPGGIVSAALSYVGNAWNNEGCWVLASDISAKAGATLPLTSTMVGVAGIGNGEWFVAYNGPVSASSGWEANLVAGEMVSFVTTSGGGHITTVVSGKGSTAQLVDNITYVGANGRITDSANDGSAADVIVQAPHTAMAEFSGVNASQVVVYELDCPVVTAALASVSVVEAASVSLASDFTASNPKAGQSVTEYQVYESNAADTLTLSGVANKTAISAATACTLTSLTGLGLAAGSTAGSDTIEVRAYNGSYWGDWTSLAVTVVAPAAVSVTGATVAQAAALQSNAQVAHFTITDTAADVTGHTALGADGKLSAITITGTTGADTLNLTGISATVTINLDGNTAKATAGLQAATMTFVTPPDMITLDSGAATIIAGMTGSAGIETIANFQFGLDQLQLTLGGLSGVSAFNTTYNGAHAIALTGGAFTEGVVLIGQPSSVTAASILASHLHTSNGVATIT